jgi:eukaryotic translation initiation factor 2C
MGVSYAAPAYYADRLCERARCYIREFLVPSQDEVKKMDALRRQEEQKKGLWPPKKFDREAERNKTRAQKDKERKALSDKKEAVEESLRKHTYDRAVQRFEEEKRDADYHDVGRDRLLKTMYWM